MSIIYIPCCHLPCLILCQCRQTNLCNVVQNSDSNIFIVFALQKSRSVLWTELVIRKMFIIGTLESCYNLFKLQQKSFRNWISTRNGLIFNYLVPCRRWYFLHCDLWVWVRINGLKPQNWKQLKTHISVPNRQNTVGLIFGKN